MDDNSRVLLIQTIELSLLADTVFASISRHEINFSSYISIRPGCRDVWKVLNIICERSLTSYYLLIK